MRTRPSSIVAVFALAAAFVTGCGAGGGGPMSPAADYAATPAREMQPSFAPPAQALAAPAPSTGSVAVAPAEPKGTEEYKDYGVNPVVDPAKDRLSTFAIDVDTASYSIARRKLIEG